MSMASRYVAFLRAINTPPRHVKMERLREVFEGLGFENVATYIASGNVIFDAADDPDMVGRIEQALADSLGFQVPTFLRSAQEVTATIDDQPFDNESGSVEVSFLYSEPTSDAVEELLATVSGSDRLAVIGRQLYWWHAGRRDESDHSEGRVVRILGMETTQRGLRTVERIVEKFLR